MAGVIKQVKIGRIMPSDNHFATLVQSIIGQQLSVKAAKTIIGRFLNLFPKARFPAPEQILKMDKEKMRACGLSYSKISYIKDLAEKVKTKEVKLAEIALLGDEEVIAELVRVKGIGRWTSEMFLIFSLGRDDIFSYGDLGIKNAIKKLYKLKAHPTPEKANKISEKWKPYRSTACRLLWKYLDIRK